MLCLLALAAWPLARSLVDEYLAARQFPLLADFETPFEHHRWVNRRQFIEETGVVRHGRKAARVRLSTAKYSGVALFYFPQDWRGYASLGFSVSNPLETGLTLNIRVHDARHKESGNAFHDRYNQQFDLAPGWNDLTISLEKVKNAPQGRSMDMAHIEGFGMFCIELAQPLEIIIDHIYLSE